MRYRPLAFCLLLLALVKMAHAQRVKIDLVGVHTPSECAGPLAALQAELHDLHFPPGWTIHVACTPVVWDELWRRAGGPPTDTAFSSIPARLTVLNGAIFRGLRNEYRQTIAHELGHITCQCTNEVLADARARELLVPRLPPVRALAFARSRPVDDEVRLPVWVAAIH